VIVIDRISARESQVFVLPAASRKNTEWHAFCVLRKRLTKKDPTLQTPE